MRTATREASSTTSTTSTSSNNSICSTAGLTFTRYLDLTGKRLLDILVSLVLLLALSPVLLLIGLIIKLSSEGPVFYTQKRAGFRQRWFQIYKFRTMKIGADKEEQIIFGKLEQDPRVTRFGMFLRKYSLDELPQLINVLLGDMSLVGPRPFIEQETVLLTIKQRQRLKVKPGITGYAQIQGRSNLPLEEIIKYDLYYVEHYSLILDLVILFKTVPYVLLHKGAY